MSERTITEQPHVDESHRIWCHVCREKQFPIVTKGYDTRGIVAMDWKQEECSVCKTYLGTWGGFYD